VKNPTLRPIVLAGLLAAAAACHGTSAANTAAAGGTAGGSSGGSAADPARAPGARSPDTRMPEAATPEARSLSLSAGTSVVLASRTALSSWHNHAGDPVTATAGAAVVDASGDTVIPRGATFLGKVTAIAPAPHPSEQGTMRVSFSEVRIQGATYPVHGEVTYLATAMKGRGVTAGTAAKVGAGAVIGGVAGRLIGGNGTGTIVGAVAGGAGGAVVAHATRTMDIILPEGATIRLKLTEPFVRAIASKSEPAAPPAA